MASIDFDIIDLEYFSDVDGEEVDDIVRHNSYNKELVDNSNALRCYLILTVKPKLLKDKQISEERLLISRYYWLKMFYIKYSRINGIDAGIEQQIFTLIETIGQRITDFDWNVLQKIDKFIESNEEY